MSSSTDTVVQVLVWWLGRSTLKQFGDVFDAQIEANNAGDAGDLVDDEVDDVDKPEGMGYDGDNFFILNWFTLRVIFKTSSLRGNKQRVSREYLGAQLIYTK
jgi:hypothetical protein